MSPDKQMTRVYSYKIKTNLTYTNVVFCAIFQILGVIYEVKQGRLS